MPDSTPQQPPLVWAIGGNDPLNLAGIGADARAVSALGGHCASIVTCVTGQNSKAFRASHATSISMLDAQWQALAEQTTPRVIKIGLLANEQQVMWLAQKLEVITATLPELRVIYDPVIKASAADVGASPSIVVAIKQHLLGQVDLLTPNTDEAEILSENLVENREEMVTAAEYISGKYQLNVLLKGGHITPALTGDGQSGDCYVGIDGAANCRYLSEPSTVFALTCQWSENQNNRGTGCLLASLIAGCVANGHTFGDACVLAKAILTKGIDGALALGNDRGGALALDLPTDFAQLPQVLSMRQFVAMASPISVLSAPPCPDNLGLYPVVDSLQWLERLLALGVKTIQLRAKGLNAQQAEPQVIAAITLGRRYNARVFINDYWQLAVKHGAYGVHLGQEDLQVADLDQIKGCGLRLGLSTHGILEALTAHNLRPSYIALGHIFATQTKDMPSNPQGVASLALQVKLLKHQTSLVAIGGISAQRVPAIVDTGIGSVALVSAITKADDYKTVTRELLANVGPGDECDIAHAEVAYG